MSIDQLKVLYEAINTDRSILTFPLFVEMVGKEKNTQTVLSWFKESSTIH